MPVAPDALTATTSSGTSMLANNSTATPSKVTALVVLMRCSFCCSSSHCSWRNLYSVRMLTSGLTITTPWLPSTMINSPSRIKSRAFCKATMDGIFRLRANMAVCEVMPPTSVMNAANSWCLNWMASAGEMSWATKISLRSSFKALVCRSVVS